MNLKTVAIILTAIVLSIFQSPTLSWAQSANGIWEGVYTDVQAERGSEQYSARCASCHSADLRGNSNSPSLLGLSFMFIWEGKSLGEIYSKMRAEMPTDQPGSLSAQSYADILAFILRANEFPDGSTEMGTNEAVLNQITITSQAASN